MAGTFNATSYNGPANFDLARAQVVWRIERWISFAQALGLLPGGGGVS
jgi:hypothetical protein